MKMKRKSARHIDPFNDIQYATLSRIWGVDRVDDQFLIHTLTTSHVWVSDVHVHLNEFQKFIDIRGIRFGFAWWVPDSKTIGAQYCVFTETEEDAILLKLTC